LTECPLGNHNSLLQLNAMPLSCEAHRCPCIPCRTKYVTEFAVGHCSSVLLQHHAITAFSLATLHMHTHSPEPLKSFPCMHCKRSDHASDIQQTLFREQSDNYSSEHVRCCSCPKNYYNCTANTSPCYSCDALVSVYNFYKYRCPCYLLLYYSKRSRSCTFKPA
jgi:hypothetical protein